MQVACLLGRGRGFLISKQSKAQIPIFQKEREHNTSYVHNEAIFTRLCLWMESHIGPID